METSGQIWWIFRTSRGLVAHWGRGQERWLRGLVPGFLAWVPFRENREEAAVLKVKLEGRPEETTCDKCEKSTLVQHGQRG